MYRLISGVLYLWHYEIRYALALDIGRQKPLLAHLGVYLAHCPGSDAYGCLA